ncbi:MAG: hypothetical protein FWE22_02660 [Firmicutes bacterium]|nr:hypothetical protein [Bacillota bacterium]
MGKRKEYKEFIKKLRATEGCQRNFWYSITNQSDIDFLMERFGGFHDSVIISANYTNGCWLSDGSITMDSEKEILSLIFKSQWVNPKLELKFIGIRRCNLIGYQDNYSSEILNCYLSFFDGNIIFANTESFDPENPMSDKLIDEDMTTFAIADKLNWRFIDIE